MMHAKNKDTRKQILVGISRKRPTESSAAWCAQVATSALAAIPRATEPIPAAKQRPKLGHCLQNFTCAAPFLFKEKLFQSTADTDWREIATPYDVGVQIQNEAQATANLTTYRFFQSKSGFAVLVRNDDTQGGGTQNLKLKGATLKDIQTCEDQPGGSAERKQHTIRNVVMTKPKAFHAGMIGSAVCTSRLRGTKRITPPARLAITILVGISLVFALTKVAKRTYQQEVMKLKSIVALEPSAMMDGMRGTKLGCMVDKCAYTITCHPKCSKLSSAENDTCEQAPLVPTSVTLSESRAPVANDLAALKRSSDKVVTSAMTFVAGGEENVASCGKPLSKAQARASMNLSQPQISSATATKCGTLAPAVAGQTKLEVNLDACFQVGEEIVIGGAERNSVTGFGSIILDSPLQNDWPEGTEITTASPSPLSTPAPEIAIAPKTPQTPVPAATFMIGGQGGVEGKWLSSGHRDAETDLIFEFREANSVKEFGARQITEIGRMLSAGEGEGDGEELGEGLGEGQGGDDGDDGDDASRPTTPAPTHEVCTDSGMLCLETYTIIGDRTYHGCTTEYTDTQNPFEWCVTDPTFDLQTGDTDGKWATCIPCYQGGGYVGEHRGDEVDCVDDPNYVDPVYGATCTSFRGYQCSESLGLTSEQAAELRGKCPMSCGVAVCTAQTSPAPPPSPQEACICMAEWNASHFGEGCAIQQHGCEAQACDGDLNPWCFVENPGCNDENNGWAYCTPTEAKIKVSGACRDVLVNGVYEFMGTTASGAPYYGNNASKSFLYYEPDCNAGGDFSERWIFHEDYPSTTRTEDLDNDRACAYKAAFESSNTVSPPFGTSMWSLFCCEAWVFMPLTIVALQQTSLASPRPITQACSMFSSSIACPAYCRWADKCEAFSPTNADSLRSVVQQYIAGKDPGYGHINGWDTSKVTEMRFMFYNAYTFNEPLNNWNTAQVTNMQSTFYRASKFNQPLNTWNTAQVVDMAFMFQSAHGFNQPLNTWNTAQVTDMYMMFYAASRLNQPLNNWNTARVKDMTWMYGGTSKYRYEKLNIGCPAPSNFYNGYEKASCNTTGGPTPLFQCEFVCARGWTGKVVANCFESGVSLRGCRQCPEGTYGDSNKCRNCTLGTFSDYAGATVCKACDAGKIAKAASNKCDPCGRGKVPNQLGSHCVDCKVGKFSFGDGFCRPCKPGMVALAGAGKCTSCDAGKVPNDVKSDCAVCAAGKFSGTASIVCEPCRAGEFSPAGSAVCKPCNDGGRSPNEDSSNCSLCEIGKRSNAGDKICTLCDAGRYSSEKGQLSCRTCELGWYSSFQGASQCQKCPGTRTTTMYKTLVNGQQRWVHRNGAENKSWCGCVKHTRMDAAGNCKDCEEGVDCIGMGEYFVKYGYAAGAVDNGELSIFRCHGIESRCKGGTPGETCAQGREGVSCAQCMRMWTPSPDGTCTECESRDTMPFVFACLASSFLLAAMYLLVDTTEKAKQSPWLLLCGMSCSIMITCVQQLGIIRMISIHWPERLRSILDLFRLLAIDIELIRLNCVASASPLGMFLAKLCIIGIGIIAVILIHIAFVRFFHQGRFREHHPSLVCGLGLFAMVFYISVTGTVLESLQCLPNPNGKETVSAHQAVVCWQTGEHRVMVFAGITALLVPVLYLVNCTVAVSRFPRKMLQGDTRFLRMYMFLFFRYRAEMYWYAPAHMCRSLLLSMTPIIPNNVGQLITMQILTLAHLVSIIYLAPWRVQHANLLDALVTTLIALIISVAGLLIEEVPIDEIVSLGIALICTITALVPLMISYALLTYLSKRRKKDFDYFLCHHKAGACCLARLLRMHLQSMSCPTFLDSDNLSNLDRLFDYVASDTQNLIVLCSMDLLMRPWCVGEIVTAMLHHVNIVKVIFMEFEEPGDELLHHYDEHVDISVLSCRGIDMLMIKKGINFLLSSQALYLPSYATRNTMDTLVNKITDLCAKREHVSGTIPIKHDPFPSDAKVIILLDYSNFEITACALVLVRLVIPHVVIRTELTPHILPKEEDPPDTTEILIILCSNGAFQQRYLLRSLQIVAERPQGCYHIPVLAEENFRFVTRQSFKEDNWADVKPISLDEEAMLSLILDVFKTIALNFHPALTEDMLTTQASAIAGRLVKHRRENSAIKLAPTITLTGSIISEHNEDYDFDLVL